VGGILLHRKHQISRRRLAHSLTTRLDSEAETTAIATRPDKQKAKLVSTRRASLTQMQSEVAEAEATETSLDLAIASVAPADRSTESNDMNPKTSVNRPEGRATDA